MNFLVIDGTQDKINFFSIFNNHSYHKTIKANKNNNEKLSIELFKFFDENCIKQSELKHIIVNQGPGKFSGIRSSIAVAKALEKAGNIARKVQAVFSDILKQSKGKQ